MTIRHDDQDQMSRTSDASAEDRTSNPWITNSKFITVLYYNFWPPVNSHRDKRELY